MNYVKYFGDIIDIRMAVFPSEWGKLYSTVDNRYTFTCCKDAAYLYDKTGKNLLAKVLISDSFVKGTRCFYSDNSIKDVVINESLRMLYFRNDGCLFTRTFESDHFIRKMEGKHN